MQVMSIRVSTGFQLPTSLAASTSRPSRRDPWGSAKGFLNQPVKFSLDVSKVLNSVSALLRHFLGDGLGGSFPIDKACPAIVGAVQTG
jgi:hypothetical protein